MKILVKKLHPDAVIPKFAHKGDAAVDVFSLEGHIIKPGQRHSFKTGLAIELPEGYAALVWEKSGLSVNHGLQILAGVIDSNYRGEWLMTLLNSSNKDYEVKKGDKLANVVIQKVESPEIIEVEELSDTERGDGGFGSTGR